MSRPALPTVLIDVRSSGEFNASHIDGAVSLPLDRFQRELPTAVPDPATPLLLYCLSGARSGTAEAIALQMGYRHARNGGGIGSLALSLGRPVIRA